ncbi:MAG: DUF726 domain-containing protein [Candidatus Nitrosotenuis sp.]
MPTSKSTKKNLRQARIPRISTRGYYDLATGKTLKKKLYDLYPKKFFEKELGNYREFTIVVHGMRNDKQGALEKFKIVQKRLRQLRYKYPVIGFSYDSNIKGIQYEATISHATMVGKIVARKNGANLARFITDFKKNYPSVKIRLIGHSLGTEVIAHSISCLKNKKDMVEAVYFFGSSLETNSLKLSNFGNIFQNVVRQKILNYYSKNDVVLQNSYKNHIADAPLGYLGGAAVISKYFQKHVMVKNHRFRSYVAELNSYP